MFKYGTLKDNEGNKIYPNAYYKIGDIFITTNEENPANRFGGTWEKLPDETFLMTASSKYAVKSTGGENEHILTIEEMPKHRLQINGSGGGEQWATGNIMMNSAYGNTQTTAYTEYIGEDNPHNNMPKFYAVYVWIRVA